MSIKLVTAFGAVQEAENQLADQLDNGSKPLHTTWFNTRLVDDYIISVVVIQLGKTQQVLLYPRRDDISKWSWICSQSIKD